MAPVGGIKFGAARTTSAYRIAVFTSLLAVLTGVVLFLLQHPTRILDKAQSIFSNVPHPYSFRLDGHTWSGWSHSPFEKARGYSARVEACSEYGIEDVLVTAMCYITLRTSVNLTISNSENYTSAVYDDGRKATICCIYVEGHAVGPGYMIKLPPGLLWRRTYERGSEVQVLVNVPDVDQNHQLDAISFSPGEGAVPVLFPIKDRIKDVLITAGFAQAHAEDPRLQRLVQDLLRTKAEIQARRQINRGLTYSP